LETLGQISRGGAWPALYRASVVAMDLLKDREKAEKYLTIVAKLDVSYKDVSERLEKLRKRREDDGE
jgi:hypothetical protein